MVAQDVMARNVPEELKQHRNWVAWGPDPKTGSPKCPLRVHARGVRASSTKPESWAEWANALIFYGKHAKPKEVGIGFVFAEALGFVYVDIDDALDEQGQLRAWAKPYVEPFIGKAYIERSPGGRGLHIITKGKLPAGGGKTNFPQHASGERVPEVAMFTTGKYTTITGDVWNEQRKMKDGHEAANKVWQLAGIKAVNSTSVSEPLPEQLIEVDPQRIPKRIAEELKECSAADAVDRSAARFKFYVEAAQRLTPEEIFSLVVQSQWYEDSGASEKGKEATWADIQRSVEKAQTARHEFESFQNLNNEEERKAKASWKDLGIAVLTVETKGGPIVTAVEGSYNIGAVLGRGPQWKGRLRHNAFKDRIELDGKPVGDADVLRLAEPVRRFLAWDREPYLNAMWAGVELAAREHSYDPVADYLKSLKWDKKPRIGSWLVRAGAIPCDLNEQLGQKWLVGLVARALQPGCKMDNVLILEGPQGKLKSTLFRTVAGGADYFTDTHLSLDKDGMMLVQGNWVVELAELATMRRADTDAMKQFLSKQEDSYRPPFGRATVTRPRHFVIVGSANGGGYLKDTTGNRRYWPVEAAGRLDVAWVKEHRDALLAEAVERFSAGERWWFNDGEDGDLQAAQEEREAVDPLDVRIGRFVEEAKPKPFTIAAFMERNGLKLEDKGLAQRIGDLLRKRGLKHYRRTLPGVGRAWVWRDPRWPEAVEDEEKWAEAESQDKGEANPDLADML